MAKDHKKYVFFFRTPSLTYKVSELQISKDNRHGANEVLCFVGLDEDQGHGTQCSDSWTRDSYQGLEEQEQELDIDILEEMQINAANNS